MDSSETARETTPISALRALGPTYERFFSLSGSNDIQEELVPEDVKYLALFAFFKMQDLIERLDEYETRGKDQWMGVAEAIKYVGCSRRTIYRGIKSGQIKSKVENGRRVLQRQSMERFAKYRDC